jgi:hypothetical protein
MHTVHRLCAVLVLLVAAFASTVSQAAVTTFTSRAAWQAAAGGTVTTIDFATKDDGSPISSPPTAVQFSSLTLKGVTFLNVFSFNNLFLISYPNPTYRINLPLGTSAVGATLWSEDNVPGVYEVRLSSGEVFHSVSSGFSAMHDFFGVVSTAPLEWIEVGWAAGSSNGFLGLDDFSFVASTTQQIRIDIKPSATNEINPVNPDANGVIPVAIISNSTFDATQVYIPSVRFGRAGTEAPIVTHSYQDTNGDGRLDVVMQFRTQSTGIQCGDTMAKLTGQTTGGTQVNGSDVIRTVGCK